MLGAEERNARTWAAACHLSALVGLVIPFGHLLGPILVWILKRGDHPLIDQAGKAAMNFQLSMTLYLLVAGLLSLIVIGIPIFFALVIADVVLVVIAGARATEGEVYRYPLTLQFIT